MYGNANLLVNLFGTCLALVWQKHYLEPLGKTSGKLNHWQSFSSTSDGSSMATDAFSHRAVAYAAARWAPRFLVTKFNTHYGLALCYQ
jgi:hypothetical protein